MTAEFSQSVTVLGNLTVTGSFSILSTPLPGVRYISFAALTAPDGVPTAVTVWNQTDYIRGAFVDTGGAITVPSPGLYSVVSQGTTTATSTTTISLTVSAGTESFDSKFANPSGVNVAHNVCAQFNIASVATPIVVTWESIGAAVPILITFLTIWRLGDPV